jgi:hypothetical protein
MNKSGFLEHRKPKPFPATFPNRKELNTKLLLYYFEADYSVLLREADAQLRRAGYVLDREDSTKRRSFYRHSRTDGFVVIYADADPNLPNSLSFEEDATPGMVTIILADPDMDSSAANLFTGTEI